MRTPEPSAAWRCSALTRRHLLRAVGAAFGGALLAGPALPGITRSSPLLPAEQSGFFGVAVDVLTGQPVPGVTITASPLGASAATDQSGAFRLDLPPGAYALTASHPAYVELTLVDQRVVPGAASVVSFDLIRTALTQEEEEIVYTRLGLQVESPLEVLPAPSAAEVAGISLPESIRVQLTDPKTGKAVGEPITVPLEDYVKGVVPNEVPYSWPAETLKAQAVAARSYGVARFLSRSSSPQGPYVWDNTNDQVYNPAKRTAQTDAAVDATRGVVVSYNGSIAQTFFFAQCNGVTTRDSERAILWRSCASTTFGTVGYCRAQPCGGHDPYPNGCVGEYYGYRGHGVGMCQFGARARANEGLAYSDILRRYYTNVEVVAAGGLPTATPLSPANGSLFLPGEVTLQWSGVNASYYYLEVTGLLGTTPVYGTSYKLSLPLGKYQWRVQAVDANGTAGNWSAYWSINVVSKIYNTIFPYVARGR